MPTTGDFRDNEWEPSDAEEAALLEDVRRTVAWQRAMAAKGIKVLALHLTLEQDSEAVEKWWHEEGERQLTAVEGR